ncbi:hypothetical protein ABPG75_001233 [Micractinium tetrahymenae]
MASRLLATRILARQRWLGAGTLLPGVQLVSCFSSGSGSAPADAATEMARALRCQDFQQGPLQSLAASRPSVPYTELLGIMQQHGFTPAAAEDVVGRLERSGAVVNLAGTVLLRPGEVAEALALVLPDSATSTRQQLERVQLELSQLEAKEARIARRAAWRQRAFVWGGFATQGMLWALLCRLTYYELSWDVMEPVCFFVGGAQAMLCYTYFMATRRDFSWEAALDRHVGQWEKRQLAAAGIDLQRFSWLRREARRLGELLAAQEAAEAVAAAAADGGEAAAAVEGKKEA